MKTIIFYYIQIILPLPLLVLLAKMDLNVMFFTMLVMYAFVYRPMVDGARLVKLGIISKNELYKNFIPFWNVQYYTELYTKI